MWKYADKKQINDFLLSLKLLNYDDQKYLKTLYTISNDVEKHYKIHKIYKRNGKIRTIYEPDATLKYIQRVILNKILCERRISKYACAYCKGKSLKDNANFHTKKPFVLKLDIKNFFDNINFIDVYEACFPIYLFPKSAGILLTYLCTYNEFLPQGAPTSAYISNLVMREFDEKIGEICEKQNISYTRYSDDMTFSGDLKPYEIISLVSKNLKKLGLKLNYQKIHVVKESSRQIVTGIVVNEKVQVSRAYREKLRQEIYYIKKYRLDSHLAHKKVNVDIDSYLASLYGKVLFVLQINKDKEFIEYKKYLKEMMNN